MVSYLASVSSRDIRRTIDIISGSVPALNMWLWCNQWLSAWWSYPNLVQLSHTFPLAIRRAQHMEEFFGFLWDLTPLFCKKRPLCHSPLLPSSHPSFIHGREWASPLTLVTLLLVHIWSLWSPWLALETGSIHSQYVSCSWSSILCCLSLGKDVDGGGGGPQIFQKMRTIILQLLAYFFSLANYVWCAF